MAHGRSYIEPRIGIIYSALDGFMNGLDTDNQVAYQLGSSRFDKLSKKLRRLIREEVDEQEIADGIIKKLPELRRRSFVERLLMLIERYDLNVTKLWPPGADIASELQALVRRRNVYVHQGKIEDYGPYLLDLYRILNLIELWILKLLEYPDAALNLLALNSYLPINKA
jgi:hypothetical protein